MSKRNSSSNILAGIGLAAIVGVVGSAAAALFVASRKAKKHNQTTKEYIAGKARKIVKKKPSVLICDECGEELDLCECTAYDEDLDIDNFDVDPDDAE